MGSRAMLSLADGQVELRSSPRFRVLLVATLVTTWCERIVKLRNISETGAMIEGDRIPRVGTDILLRRGALELFATIVWAKDKQAGLEFDQPLTQVELWMQVNAPSFTEGDGPGENLVPLRPHTPLS